MKTVGIFYGSSTGNTEDAAKLIASKLGVSDIIDVAKASGDQLASYQTLLLGSSTWGIGDLQDDWDGFIEQLKKQDLSGKTVAVFGCGDSSSYSDSFCDAIGHIAQAAQEAGATLVGCVDASGYEYDDSQSVKDGKFQGLPLDFDNESDKTEQRVSDWVEQLKTEAGI